MLTLEFPRLVTIAYAKTILSLCHRSIHTREGEICFDLRKTEFVTPFGVTALAGTIAGCLNGRKKVSYRRPRKQGVHEWLSRISFSRFFEIDDLQAQAKVTSIELRRLTGLNPIYIEDLVNLLDSNMNLSRGVRDSIQLSIQELLTNVFDHSQSKIGCFVCAQYTPHSQLIRLSVSDFGIGIARSLKQVPTYSNIKTSSEAITRAVEEGVSSRKGKAGLGLYHIRRFAKINEGTLTVVSGDGKVNFYSKSIDRSPITHPFNGTAIEMKIRADKEGFYFLQEEKEYIF